MCNFVEKQRHLLNNLFHRQKSSEKINQHFSLICKNTVPTTTEENSKLLYPQHNFSQL